MAEYTVIGSRGTAYTVVIQDIHFSCTCMAGRFGDLCKHVRQAAKEHGETEFNEVVARLDAAEGTYKSERKKSQTLFEAWRDDPSPMALTDLELSCRAYREIAQTYAELKAEYGAER
ncbi:MAG: hypothetical protein IMZ50_11015 [Candidatus Atribacteria bacterium]|nr:hypothetical protein [Candidatus Atribacteria bacterium]